MKLPNTRSSVPKSVRWNHLPHEPLSLEIASRISHRQPAQADQDVKRTYLLERLRLLELEEHDEYINLVAAEVKRELRICRDVYRDYLSKLNNRSATVKDRVALEFAVAPMASRRLRHEIIRYVSHVGVSDLMFAVLFYRLADRLLTLPSFSPDWLDIENVTNALIPERCFQNLRKATPRELEFVAASPFLDPAQPFDRFVFNPSFRVEVKPNTIWDHRNVLLGYELWRLWGFVFHEICDEHAAIDCEEKSNVALALMALTPFERLAGRMFFEEGDRHVTHVPDEVFAKMGTELDNHRIPLADNVDATGKEILKHLARKGKSVESWKDALADKREHRFLPEKVGTRQQATTLKEFGTLSRCAKRAFYRAKEAYREALEKIYEQRLPAEVKANPFAARL